MMNAQQAASLSERVARASKGSGDIFLKVDRGKPTLWRFEPMDSWRAAEGLHDIELWLHGYEVGREDGLEIRGK